GQRPCRSVRLYRCGDRSGAARRSRDSAPPLTEPLSGSGNVASADVRVAKAPRLAQTPPLMFAGAPVFPIKPPKGFEAPAAAVVGGGGVMMVSALRKAFREGEMNRAERRRDCVPRHDPSSSEPHIGQVSDPPARVSAHTTLGARHSAETTLVPTS